MFEQNPTVFISSDQISARVRELGQEITRHYEGEEVVLIGVLKGCFTFLADLARTIDLPLSVEFLGVSSYGDKTESTGVVKITSDLTKPIDGKHVIIVEDIVDTGLTMAYLLDNFKTRMPRSMKVCSLLYKPDNAMVDVPIDFLGFTIPDHFVIGYGMDLAEKYRNLPYLGVLEPKGIEP